MLANWDGRRPAETWRRRTPSPPHRRSAACEDVADPSESTGLTAEPHPRSSDIVRPNPALSLGWPLVCTLGQQLNRFTARSLASIAVPVRHAYGGGIYLVEDKSASSGGASGSATRAGCGRRGLAASMPCP